MTDISIVIPAYNEAESIGPLVTEISQATGALPVAEIIVVDDGSNDNMKAVLSALGLPKLKVYSHAARSGQSTAIRTGIQRARSPLIVTMDGDGQNDPGDIAAMVSLYTEHAARNPRALVAGQRVRRQDDGLRLLSSRVANNVRGAILKDGVRDTGCGLKLFRREDFLELPFFDHIHRFIPALMKAKGVDILLMDVSHRPRVRGQSKYGVMNRLWVGIADLFGVRWILSRVAPPAETRE